MRKIIETAIEGRLLEKLILSKPADKSLIKTVGKLFEKNNILYMQLETFHNDGKATHVNIEASEAADTVEKLIKENYRQADIITSGGNCQILVSRKGKIHIAGSIESDAPVSAVGTHDKIKNYVLEGSERFLILLGISGENGKVLDKQRAKFRQINRFMELVGDIYDKLPHSGIITICDLCCGKSYLTFAVYHYLTEILHRDVKMYGIDLKPDVIEYCSSVASEIEYTGLEFTCGDVSSFVPLQQPDLLISLHACDTATDLVLAFGIKNGIKIILSTPCCHHEMLKQINCEPLEFITSHQILKQKLCDAATDALRCKRLEIEGYNVTALELIDPDETPKNVMIRAIKTGDAKPELRAEYDNACKLLGVKPYLDTII